MKVISLKARDIVAELLKDFPDVHVSLLYFVTFHATIAVACGNKDAGLSLVFVSDNAFHITALLAEELGVSPEVLRTIYERADLTIVRILEAGTRQKYES